MLIVSPATAASIAPHTGHRAWVMFVQAAPPDGIGPIWIEAIAGAQIGIRLGEIARFNHNDTFLVGLVETVTPEPTARAIREQYAGQLIRGLWFQPTPDLLAYIQHVAQEPVRRLIAEVHPGSLSTETVDVEQIAAMLNVTPATVYRMVKANEIPCYRVGRLLRFVPAEVIASLKHRVDGRR